MCVRRSGGSGTTGRGQILLNSVIHSVSTLIKQDELYKRVQQGSCAVHALPSRDCHGHARAARANAADQDQGCENAAPAAPRTPRSHGVGSHGRGSVPDADGNRPPGTYSASLTASNARQPRCDIRKKPRKTIETNTERMVTEFANARNAVQRGAMSVDEVGVSHEDGFPQLTVTVTSEGNSWETPVRYKVVLSSNCSCSCPNFRRQLKSGADALCKHICAVTNQRLREHQQSLISCNLHALKQAEVQVLMDLPFLAPLPAQDGETYLIDRVLLEKVGDDGLPCFFVTWKGYEDGSWEPENNLPLEIVGAYRARQRGQGIGSRSQDHAKGGMCEGGKGRSQGGTGASRPTSGKTAAKGRGSVRRQTAASPARSTPKSHAKGFTENDVVLSNLPGNDSWGIALSKGKQTQCKSSKRDTKRAPGHACSNGTEKGKCMLVAAGYRIHHMKHTPERAVFQFCAGDLDEFRCPANFVSEMHRVQTTKPAIDICRIEDAEKFVVCDGVAEDADPEELDALKAALRHHFQKPIVDSSDRSV